jgi:hypothetical protein
MSESVLVLGSCLASNLVVRRQKGPILLFNSTIVGAKLTFKGMHLVGSIQDD